MSTLSAQFATASSSAASVTQVDEIARLSWQAWGRGLLSDDAAQATQIAADERKKTIRAFATAPSKRLSAPSPRRPIQRQRSIARRRRISMSGLMPARLAASFTQAEVAALSVISREIKQQRNNLCEFAVGKISALAGCCETTTRNALREAYRLELLTVTERRRNGRPSLTNHVSITSPLWQSWLRLGSQKGRVQKNLSHVVTRDNPTSSPPKTTPETTAKPRDRERRSNFSGRRPINLTAL